MRRFSASSVFGLLLSMSVATAAFAAPLAPENDLPTATNSDDGQFVFVPLVGDQKQASDTASEKKTPKVVLALGGGGMRGAAHVGVLKALVEAGIPIDGIAGTSMGSIVGGMYSAGVPLSEIEKRFVDGSLMKSFVPIPLPLRVVMAPVLNAPRLVGFRTYDGLYYGTIFHRYLNKALPEGKKSIENLNIPYSAVAIDLCDGHVYAIRKGSLISAMQASSAVPGLRKPISIGDKLLVDGGVLANVPVPHARQLGGDIVIAVQIDEHFDKATPAKFHKIGSVPQRMLGLQLSALDAFHERNADIIIHPNVDGVNLISTKISDAKRAIAAGEAATKEQLPAIKQKLSQLGIAGLQQAQ